MPGTDPHARAPGAGHATDADNTLHVVLSIDVEEEGLFGGSYTSSAGVRNVSWLKTLPPLLQRVGMPVTLLCAHSVFSDAAACRALDEVRAACRVEIGAHLHHWSTPPLQADLRPEVYRSAGAVPDAVMEAKLHSLFAAGRLYAGHALTSFRMGRWDMHRSHWPLLARCGVLTDSSVRPLHCGTGQPEPIATMPDHFTAPPHPYRMRVPLGNGSHEIFEAPLTCVPLAQRLMPLLCALPRPQRAKVQKMGALVTQAVYHPQWALRAIARAQLAQGQRVLHLTWHSSEMMPGGAPHIPDEAAAQGLLARIENFLLWLRAHWQDHGKGSVRGVTLDQLRQACSSAPLIPSPHQPSALLPYSADWIY